MTPGLLPLLLLLLAGPPSAQPAPPTCYSRMLTLSREVAGDFQSLQATEPSVSPLPPALRAPGGSMQTPFSKTCLWTRKKKNKALFFFSGQGFAFYSHPTKYNDSGLHLFLNTREIYQRHHNALSLLVTCQQQPEDLL